MNAIWHMAAPSPTALRRLIRSGAITGQTSGLASGFVQANLVIVPADWAADFLRFCRLNPKPCPLLAMSEPGDPSAPALGADLDIRTDLPSYRVFHHGEPVAQPTDIMDLWRGDLVSFLIGCSFTFERALLAAGLPVRHIELGRNVPMYRTNIDCVPAGDFSGKMVVSMRPFRAADARRAAETTAAMPQVHGAPVHLGAPERIGIEDLGAPDFGDAVPVGDDEIPVFWACGVTPQLALAAARPPLAITHSPGHMLITDITDDDLLTGRFTPPTAAGMETL